MFHTVHWEELHSYLLNQQIHCDDIYIYQLILFMHTLQCTLKMVTINDRNRHKLETVKAHIHRHSAFVGFTKNTRDDIFYLSIGVHKPHGPGRQGG